MSLSIGIVGLPNVGKSTLFRALTKKEVASENYPFCTIDPAVGVVPVPDERLDALASFSQSEKKIPPVVEFVDIAGLVEGAASGEGLGNTFLSHIREVDAILHMVRIFPVDGAADDITHVYGSIDPIRDIGVITLELVLADLETVRKRRERVEKEVKRGDRGAQTEARVLDALAAHLEEEQPVHAFTADDQAQAVIDSLHLLTAKPVIFGLNKKIGTANLDETDPEQFAQLQEYIKELGASSVVFDARSEDELKDMSSTEKQEFLAAYNEGEVGIEALIRASYDLLGLITFYTTGPKETRGWTIQEGARAPEAGAAIHTDFQKNFIRAAVINWQTLLDAGSYADARAQGLERIEGKDYIVSDGDVIEFKV